MDFEKMGGVSTYLKWVNLVSKDYTSAPLNCKYKTPLDYYATDGPGNWEHGLSHYCSMETLKSIIQNRDLRFTFVRDLEDSTEFRNAIKLLKKVIKEQRKEMSKELYDIVSDKEMFEKLREDIQRYPFYPPINDKGDIDSVKPTCKVYTCSMSLHGDLKKMWKKYATERDNGVSVEFSQIKQNMGSDDRVKLIFGKVWYNNRDKKICINALLKDIYEIFPLIPDEECRKDMVQAILISAMNHMRIFMKKRRFKFEDEYRGVLIIPEEIINEKCMPKGYIIDKSSVKENGDVLHIDVPLNIECIKEILVRKDNNNNLLISNKKEDLDKWLLQQGLKNIRIHASKVC